MTTPEEVITSASNGDVESDTDQTYSGISKLRLSPAQQKTLTAPIADEDVEIRPDGLVYAEQAWYRKRLCAVLGSGRWGLRRITEWSLTKNRASAEFALYINGHFIASSVGEHLTRNGIDGDTTESIKSNALMRCCKDLGMSLELWTASWRDRWISEHAERVNGKWRRKATTNTEVGKPLTEVLADESLVGTNGEDRLSLDLGKEPSEEPRATRAQLMKVKFDAEHRGIPFDAVNQYVRETFHVETAREMLAADVHTLNTWINEHGEGE